MIISKTPFRVSLMGGGTDFPSYYKNSPGLVIGGTIDKYCYVTARFLPDVFDYKHRIVWSKNEVVNNNDEILHPTVKAVFKYLNIQKGLEIHYQGDLQKNSGLGTSSSFCVGLLNSINKLYNKKINKEYLAKVAINIEQNVMREKCGSQDQIWASYGGFNAIEFKGKNFKIITLKINNQKLKNLSKNLFLIYTGINKFSHEIENDKILKLQDNSNNLDKIYDLAKTFKESILNNKNFDFLGPALDEYWNLKKSLSNKVSGRIIDEIYNEAKLAGCSGGKIIGSGGGGFLLVHCKKKFHSNLYKRLNKLPIIKFNFVSKGSEVIFKS